ncbi:MAG TPA: glycoside hydrolase family 3 N-terminal domain-containing protein [Longimicrobiales bacterium]|nr:glycoside hydrolase family 3 N-terminal domain-containing protein [Longimicrobiales bacterium]
MTRTGRLLFPALRWQEGSGFDHERSTIDDALAIGAGGFIVFGGRARAVAELTAELRERSRVPLLIASDVERGAGQQFTEATALPPLAALGSLVDAAVTRRAGALTARESLALGVNWLYAPVADVDLEPRNPIVGSRSFGTDAAHVAAQVGAWIEGAHEEGALCCAKHFPGHGRTVDDSHAALPRVSASRAELELDLLPFRAAIAAAVDAMMTAHVVYDALDGSTAATLSHAILTVLLREQLDFQGLVVSDALIMEGMLRAGGGSETAAAIAALGAGCDALLYPSDVRMVAAALEQAAGREVDSRRIAEAIGRIDAACARAHSHTDVAWGTATDRAWADDVAVRCCTVARGAPRGAAELDLITIDDDVGGPYPPPARDTFARTLRDAGVTVHDATHPSAARAACLAVYSDIRAWKGSPGLSARATGAVRAALGHDHDATIVFFGHRRLCDDVPGRHLLVAWGGEAVMQRAAARWLVRAS